MLSTSFIPTLAAISAFLALTSAAPVESTPLAKRDGAMFTLSVNDVMRNMPGFDKAPIQARNGSFYIGKEGPMTGCPPTGPCPTTDKTVFQCVADNTNTTCYLATQSGKQPIYLEKGALQYAPSYMYGSLTPALVPTFEHTSDQFLASQVYGGPGGAFFNENWYGCSSSDSLNPNYAAPYQLFFASSGVKSKCEHPSAWIQIVATPVSAASAYSYTF